MCTVALASVAVCFPVLIGLDLALCCPLRLGHPQACPVPVQTSPVAPCGCHRGCMSCSCIYPFSFLFFLIGMTPHTPSVAPAYRTTYSRLTVYNPIVRSFLVSGPALCPVTLVFLFAPCLYFHSEIEPSASSQSSCSLAVLDNRVPLHHVPV